jgi:hypothetical protein
MALDDHTNSGQHAGSKKRERTLRVAIISAALAVGLLLGAVGYSLVKEEPEPSVPAAQAEPQASAAPAPRVQLPEPFREATGQGTPGEAVAWYIDKGTPEAGMDAFRLITSCQISRAARACEGITPAMEARAGELIATAMEAGVPGAAVAFYGVMRRVPDDAFKEAEQMPALRQGIDAMVLSLKKAATESNDRSAISVLSTLYSGATPMVRRDPVAALTYVTALRELNPPDPRFAASAEKHMAQLLAELTPEQVQAAKAEGVKLARVCNCKEG